MKMPKYKIESLKSRPIENKIGNVSVKSTHTTGDALQINKMLNDMIESGCEYCFMEVSSHAIHQKRVENLKFDGGIFTNISHGSAGVQSSSSPISI